MLRKVVTVLMILCVAVSFAKDFRTTDTKVISRTDNRVVIEKDGFFHHMQVVNKPGRISLAKTNNVAVMDTILRFAPPANSGYYNDVFADLQNLGAAGGLKDTIIKRFNLLAPGRIKKVMMQNKHAGTAELQFWGPCFFEAEDSRFVNLPENPYVSGETSIPGAQPFLPFSATVSCDAHDPEEQFNELGEWTPQWNVFDLDVLYPGLNPLLTGDSLELWVGYATDGVSGPSIWQDGEYIQEAGWWWDRYSFSTLKSQGTEPASYYNVGSTDDDGNRNGINHIMQIVVEYEAVPPFIENATVLSNMYATEAVVTADVFDLDSESFTAQVQYKIGTNGESADIDMQATGNGDEYTATISASVGDTVYYVVKANDGELENYESNSYYEYVIKPAPQDKDILVIRQGSYNVDSLYYEVLGDAKTEYWIMNEENGLHKSVVNAGFDVVIVAGYGTTIVPIFDEDDEYGFGDLLNSGKDLVLADPDWAFANPEATSLVYVPLAEGDFAYDYFGIDTLVNDPNDGAASLADDEFVGVEGHAITGDFTGGITYGPLVYSILGGSNWGDFAYPNDEASSMTIFTGANNDYSSAVMNKTANYTAIYFGFWPEVVATDQASEFETLLNNILDNTTAVDDGVDNVAAEFALKQNYPNPFNPTTQIEYSIPAKSLVSLKIYDINGNLIRTLHNSAQAQGRYNVTWDATNDFGARVASGVYFYKLQTETRVMTRKMLLMK